MKKFKLKLLYNIISDEITNQQDDFDCLQWHLAIMDIIESKLYSIQCEKIKA